jgi:hypothetical protein
VGGDGGFFAWGYVDNTVADASKALTARVESTTQKHTVTLLPQPGTDPQSPPPTGMVPFAFRFDNVPTKVALTLYVTYTDMGGVTHDGTGAQIMCMA